MQRHHLVNQIANLALLEWHDNIRISATDPSVYWPAELEALRTPKPGVAPLTDDEISEMVEFHGLAPNWPLMAYDEFLDDRRRRMAVVVKRAFERLKAGDIAAAEPHWPPTPARIAHLLREGETTHVEFKSSLRADTLGRGIPPRVLERVAARTIAGFMNRSGGLLVIGAADDGTPVGLDADLATLQRRDLDGFQQALVQVIASHLGTDVAASVRIHIAHVGGGQQIVIVGCPSSHRPVYLTDGQAKEFHVRAGNTTRLLNVEEANSYVASRWSATTR